MSDRSAVRIEPWGEDDLQLLEKLMGDPEMTAHLGGPESPEKIAERQTRYERSDSGMFRIVDGATGEAVGSVGYVIPAFQGRGIARMATAQAIAMARSESKHRFLHAFPSVDNPRRTGSARDWVSHWWRSASSSTHRGTSCSAMTGVSTSSRAASCCGRQVAPLRGRHPRDAIAVPRNGDALDLLSRKVNRAERHVLRSPTCVQDRGVSIQAMGLIPCLVGYLCHCGRGLHGDLVQGSGGKKTLPERLGFLC
jgi:GNAT superfamily N-acetyltransferase